MLTGGEIILLLLGTVILYSSFGIMIQGAKTGWWLTVTGEVVHLEILINSDVDNVSSYTPLIYYKYQIGSVSYETAGFSYKLPTSSKRSAEKAMAKYPVGEKVTVYYNPKNPKIAVLEPGYSIIRTTIMIGVGTALLSYGLRGSLGL